MTENPYVKQFPELMAGCTVLYCHGFGSSGQSGTVARLRTVLPQARVIAPDLPIHPQEAMQLLRDICQREQPDLIIGTSMGGMYAEQLQGFNRICVNPALEMGETMRQHGLTGTQQFQNPRLDGQQEFYVDKALVREYKDITEQGRLARQQVTADEARHVWGLFGDKDDVVDTYDLFRTTYDNALHFHGEHRMDDRSFMHAVVPVIRWIDDCRQQRQRPIIYIGVETLINQHGKPMASAQKAVRMLVEHYQVLFVAPPPADNTSATFHSDWLQQYIDVPAWHHTVFTARRDLLYGDYFVACGNPHDAMTQGDLLATLLEFGSDTFKTWDDIIDYFQRLGGQ